MQSHATSAARSRVASASTPAAATRNQLAAQCIRDSAAFSLGGAVHAAAASYPGYRLDSSTENIAQGLNRAAASLRKASDVTRPTIASDLERLRSLLRPVTFYSIKITEADPATAAILRMVATHMDTVIAALRAP